MAKYIHLIALPHLALSMWGNLVYFKRDLETLRASSPTLMMQTGGGGVHRGVDGTI
jgi:hypothetical protein